MDRGLIDEKLLKCFPDIISTRLFNDRTIIIIGDICEDEVDNDVRKLHTMAETEGDILLLITSQGGSAEAGNALIRAIRHAQLKGCHVIGEVRGYAMSMGSIILQACDSRFAAPEDILMIHGGTSSAIGDIRNQEADIALSRKIMHTYADFIAARNTSKDETFHKSDYWRKLLADNFPHYYFGEEALEFGLIDEVIL